MAKGKQKGGETAPAEPVLTGLMTALVGVAEVSELIMIGDERIRQLVADNRIPPARSRGVYSLAGVVQGYIAFLKDEDRAGTKTAAESGVKRARELEIMQRVRERAGDLIPAKSASEALDDIIGLVLSELDGLPARFTRDMKIRRALEAKLDDLRARIIASLDEKIVALRAGEETAPSEADHDA